VMVWFRITRFSAGPTAPRQLDEREVKPAEPSAIILSVMKP